MYALSAFLVSAILISCAAFCTICFWRASDFVISALRPPLLAPPAVPFWVPPSAFSEALKAICVFFSAASRALTNWRLSSASG